MDSLIFALNATLPIILMVIVGYFLKRIGLISKDLAKGMNTLVFKVFLPVMLFLNIYKVESFAAIDFGYVLYAIGAVLLIWIVMIPITLLTVKEKERRGVMIQAAFRSNFTLVGVPLAESLFGEEGGMIASLLAAFVVILFNVLAVISLTAFGGSGRIDIKKILIGIIKNPLMDGIALGLICLGIRSVFTRYGIDFRISDIAPVYKTATQLSAVATPIALIVLGAQFEISAVPHLKKYIITGVLLRNLTVPILGIGAAYLIGKFGGAHFAAFMGVFSTPVAVSTVPMAQEMGGDHELAGQLVIWTTVGSAVTIFAGSFILRELGIFI